MRRPPWPARMRPQQSGPDQALALPASILAKVDALIADPKGLAEARAVTARHAYATTAMMTLLNAARLHAGVLAPAQFAWLKLVDRSLWYALHSLGYETEGFGRYLHPNPRVEAGGQGPLGRRTRGRCPCRHSKPGAGDRSAAQKATGGRRGRWSQSTDAWATQSQARTEQVQT